MATVQAAPTPTQPAGPVPQVQVSQQEFKEALQVRTIDLLDYHGLLLLNRLTLNRSISR